jgi:hypothetical protein
MLLSNNVGNKNAFSNNIGEADCLQVSAFFIFLFNCLMKTKLSTFYMAAVEYHHVRGPLFQVQARTEKEARAKLRFRLGMGRCPNGTKFVDLFTI